MAVAWKKLNDVGWKDREVLLLSFEGQSAGCVCYIYAIIGLKGDNHVSLSAGFHIRSITIVLMYDNKYLRANITKPNLL